MQRLGLAQALINDPDLFVLDEPTEGLDLAGRQLLRQVIRDLNLKIDDNEFIVLLGQSGCGKTTTLRAIAGLETIDEGDILIDGEPVQHLKASDRDIAMVFQSFSLYPHMSVYENIAFPLKATRMSTTEVDKEVREIAKVLRITDLLGKKPSALSGGDMQRVAIGRRTAKFVRRSGAASGISDYGFGLWPACGSAAGGGGGTSPPLRKSSTFCSSSICWRDVGLNFSIAARSSAVSDGI